MAAVASPNFVFSVATSPVSLVVSESPVPDRGVCEDAGVDDLPPEVVAAACSDGSVGVGAPLATGVIESLKESR